MHQRVRVTAFSSAELTPRRPTLRRSINRAPRIQGGADQFPGLTERAIGAGCASTHAGKVG
jgi:hypothetical protein